jgi:hypothetical protein
MKRLIKRNVKIAIVLIALSSLISCGPTTKKEEESDAEFLFPLTTQSFSVQSYRVLDGGGFSAISGTSKFTFTSSTLSVEYISYSDFSSSCTANYTANLTALTADEINAGSGNDVFDINDPYLIDEPTDENEEEKKEVLRQFYDVNIDTDTIDITGSCGITIFNNYTIHTELFFNGDLIIKDFSRTLDFFLRP